MIKNLLAILVLFCSFVFHVNAKAEDNTNVNEEADRETLRGMLAQVEQSINDRDLSKITDFFLNKSVVVFQNKTVLTGPDELQGFFDKMLGSSSSVLEDISSTAAIAAPASFYGPDTATAHGTLTDTYTFRGGSEMVLESVWTTTVVRQEEKWRIASLHFSANVFDNPVIDNTKRFILWAAVGGLVVGLLLTWLVMRRRKRVA